MGPRGFTEFSTTITNAIMLNVLGDKDTPNKELETCRRALETPHSTVYLYGKTTRPERKMGHINIVTSSMDDAENRLAYIMGKSDKLQASPDANGERQQPLVGIIMGSDSDLPVMAVGARILKQFGVPFELTIVSAHRTPHRMSKYAMTPLPVIGVPVKGSTLDGVDSLHSIVQMPRGIPVATVAINNSTNAALLAVRILGAVDSKWLNKMTNYMQNMEEEVLKKAEVVEEIGYEDYLTDKL